MSQRLVDLEKSNLYLFNLLFRHQVYLEGVKADFASHFRQMITELYGEFAKYIGQSRYDTVDAFSRVELQQFIYRFKAAQNHQFNLYTQKLIGLLKDFLAADVAVTSGIYGVVTALPSSEHKQTGLAALAEFAAGDRNDKLWESIAQAIVPATGLTIQQMLSAFTANAITKVNNRIMIGYANNETLKDMFAGITGEAELNFKDGLFATFTTQSNAVVATVLQHVSSLTQGAIAAELYSEDQWVSILDNVTTPICRERDGNIYPSHEGPYPPAHWNCRSKRVPLTNGDALHDLPKTFFDWAVSQPEAFLVDSLGLTLASKILADDNNEKDISINKSAIPLTVDEFGRKINLITM